MSRLLRPPMRFFSYGFGFIVFLFALAWAYGSTLPAEHDVYTIARYSVAPEVLWPLLAEPEQQLVWRTDLETVDALPERDGNESWRETGSMGPMDFVRRSENAPSTLTVEIVDNAQFGGSWTYYLVPEAGGTRLTIRERGEVYSPLLRLISTHVIGPYSTMKAIHNDLARHLGDEIVIARGEGECADC